MIPDISLMIGCYIITKMVSIANHEEESQMVKILCAITILITAYCIVDIFRAGSSIPNLPRP